MLHYGAKAPPGWETGVACCGPTSPIIESCAGPRTMATRAWTRPNLSIRMGTRGTRDNQGRPVACEQDTRRVRRREYDGMWTVLADNYQGKKLNAPNDAAVHADGSVYNTEAAILSNITNGPVRRHKTEIRGCLSTSSPPELWITRRRPRPLARAPSSRCKRAEALRMEARTKHARVAASRPAWTTNMG